MEKPPCTPRLGDVVFYIAGPENAPRKLAAIITECWGFAKKGDSVPLTPGFEFSYSGYVSLHVFVPGEGTIPLNRMDTVLNFSNCSWMTGPPFTQEALPRPAAQGIKYDETGTKVGHWTQR